MLYKIIDQEDTFSILETQTYNIVASDLVEDEARIMCRGLNMGNGFDGFTPDFFLEEVNFNAN